MNLRLSWWCVLPLAFAGAALAVPWLLQHSFAAFGFALVQGFSLVCHQSPERCFWIFGAPVAVCARCLGIYLGAAAGLLLRTSRTMAVRLFIAAAAINLLDVLTEFIGLHGNWMGVRFAFGVALGATGALLVSSSVSEPSPELESALVHNLSCNDGSYNFSGKAPAVVGRIPRL